MKTIIFLLIAAVYLIASPADSLFGAANKLYKSEKFDSAATLYSEALRLNGESSSILYNLGNCSFRLGHLGEAILYTERAAQLAPNDADIKANLVFLRTQIADDLSKEDSNPIIEGLATLHNFLSLKQQLIAIVLLSLLVPVCVYLILFGGRVTRIWAIYGVGTVVLLITVIGTSAGIKIHRIESVPQAIILDDVLEAHSEPTGGGKLIFAAHQGTKLTILSSDGTWSQVALPNGTSGYVREKSLGRI